MGEGAFTITSNVDAKYVYLFPEKGSFNISENYFDLRAGESKRLQFSDRYFSMQLIPKIKIRSLYDVIAK
jgi:Ig-fold domain